MSALHSSLNRNPLHVSRSDGTGTLGRIVTCLISRHPETGHDPTRVREATRVYVYQAFSR